MVDLPRFPEAGSQALAVRRRRDPPIGEPESLYPLGKGSCAGTRSERPPTRKARSSGSGHHPLRRAPRRLPHPVRRPLRPCAERPIAGGDIVAGHRSTHRRSGTTSNRACVTRTRAVELTDTTGNPHDVFFQSVPTCIGYRNGRQKLRHHLQHLRSGAKWRSATPAKRLT